MAIQARESKNGKREEATVATPLTHCRSLNWEGHYVSKARTMNDDAAAAETTIRLTALDRHSGVNDMRSWKVN